MHTVFWSAKRTHQTIWKFGYRVLRRCGITPARYDLLVLLSQNRVERTQKAVRRALGVARATMSEMLGKVEELGLVKRGRCADRRMRTVEITARGAEVLERVRARGAQLDVDWKMEDAFERDHPFDGKTGERRDEFDASCAWLRSGLGDVAIRALYEWPADFD